MIYQGQSNNRQTTTTTDCNKYLPLQNILQNAQFFVQAQQRFEEIINLLSWQNASCLEHGEWEKMQQIKRSDDKIESDCSDSDSATLVA